MGLPKEKKNIIIGFDLELKSNSFVKEDILRKKSPGYFSFKASRGFLYGSELRNSRPIWENSPASAFFGRLLLIRAGAPEALRKR